MPDQRDADVPPSTLWLMQERDVRLQALRATLDASIRAGGAHSDEDVTRALDEEEAALARDGG